jgi:hypothetical protein
MERPFRALRDLGLSCFPLRWRDKHPDTAHLPTVDIGGRAVATWKPYQSRLATDAEVDRWDRGRLNVGLATGRVSGVVVVDLDGPEADAAVRDRGGLPLSWTALTGKGRHVYLAHPGFECRNRAGVLPKVDIRGDGGYVVAPPSIHPLGHAYEWQANPWDDPLAPMPAWLLALLAPPRVVDEPVPAPRRDRSRYAEAALQGEAEAVAEAPVGAQEHTLNRAAWNLGTLIGSGELTADEVRAALISAGLRMANAPGKRPWSRREIEWKVDRAMQQGRAHPRSPSARRDDGARALYRSMAVAESLVAGVRT